jgi:glutathione S-transferase
MKLFYVPGGCSMAVHIALIELGMPYELVLVSQEKKASDGRDFLSIHPTGFTPAVEFDQGNTLGEAQAILLCLAEQSGKLLPPSGWARWKTLEALSFLVTEIHGSFRPFWKKADEPEKDRARTRLHKHFDLLAGQLEQRRFAAGDELTIVDPYLFVMLFWATIHKVEVPPPLQAYFAQMKARPSFAEAFAREGLG